MMRRKRRFKPSGDVDRTAGLITELIEAAKRQELERVEHDFSFAHSLCESPIEKLFVTALLSPDVLWEYDVYRREILAPPSRLVAHAEPPPFPGLYVYPQIIIGDYRVDFLLRYVGYGDVRTLIVECDGHDFHEKTKDQARRDKARDRFLVSRGYRLVRFTGSEVFADPSAVASEAIDILLEIAA